RLAGEAGGRLQAVARSGGELRRLRRARRRYHGQQGGEVMTWVQSSSQRSVVLRADLERAREFLGRIAEGGRLMPGVEELTEVAPGVFHYRLAEFSDGAVRFTPDYETRFDAADPGNLRWEPHGEHNFRSWGVFHTEPGAVAGETVLEISVRSEAD